MKPREEGVGAPPGVEDPISAIFDLADRAAEMAPVVRRLYLYTAGILAVWFAIMLVLILVGLGSGGFLSLLALAGLGAGIIAFGLLRQTDRFFRNFTQRHRWIHLVRDADPGAKVPEGRTPVERLARYLAVSNPTIDGLLRSTPDALRYKVGVRAGDREVPFDLAIVRPGGSLWKWTGWGDPGFAVVARQGPDAPTLEDLRRFETDATAVGRSLGGRMCRAILIRTGAAPIPDAVYEYAVGHPFVVEGARATLEIITENPGGTYDFVPHVLGVP